MNILNKLFKKDKKEISTVVVKDNNLQDEFTKDNLAKIIPVVVEKNTNKIICKVEDRVKITDTANNIYEGVVTKIDIGYFKVALDVTKEKYHGKVRELYLENIKSINNMECRFNLINIIKTNKENIFVDDIVKIKKRTLLEKDYVGRIKDIYDEYALLDISKERKEIAKFYFTVSQIYIKKYKED